MTSSRAAHVALSLLCLLTVGCGVAPHALTAPTAAGSGIKGHVHGGQQPVTDSKVYLYAVSTTEDAGPAASILKDPGYVTTDASGNFDISGDYTCPDDAFVYLLATGGNPGLTAGTNNVKITLAAGLGACSALQSSSDFEINEVTTIGLAHVVQGNATSATNIGAPGAGTLLPNFAEILTFIDPATGTALATDPNNGPLAQDKIDALANSLAACINSDGVGDPCASLLTDTTVGGGSGPADTFGAALSVAQNPTFNVAKIFQLGAASGAFQPALQTAPSDWSLPVPDLTATYITVPAFFDGEVDQGNGQYYLTFSGGTYFGYYSFLTASTLNHVDMGKEFFSDAADGQNGLYMYDFTSGHTWYTNPNDFPYIYDFNLEAFIYYYPDTTLANHYTTNPRYFYDFATDTILSM